MKKNFLVLSLLAIIGCNFSCHCAKKSADATVSNSAATATKAASTTVSTVSTTTKNTATAASKAATMIEPTFGMIGPAATIYKTKNDYSHLVPITLSDDGQSIVTYPAPTDLTVNGKLVLPTKLSKGYLLDNRGINAHSVFLSITYEDYSQLQQPLTTTEMLSKIVDKHPFTEFYNCGLRSAYGQNLVDNINTLIDNDGLKKCKCMTK